MGSRSDVETKKMLCFLMSAMTLLGLTRFVSVIIGLKGMGTHSRFSEKTSVGSMWIGSAETDLSVHLSMDNRRSRLSEGGTCADGSRA